MELRKNIFEDKLFGSAGILRRMMLVHTTGPESVTEGGAGTKEFNETFDDDEDDDDDVKEAGQV